MPKGIARSQRRGILNKRDIFRIELPDIPVWAQVQKESDGVGYWSDHIYTIPAEMRGYIFIHGIIAHIEITNSAGAGLIAAWQGFVSFGTGRVSTGNVDLRVGNLSDIRARNRLPAATNGRTIDNITRTTQVLVDNRNGEDIPIYANIATEAASSAGGTAELEGSLDLYIICNVI